jgi:hypothetical protein
MDTDDDNMSWSKLWDLMPVTHEDDVFSVAQCWKHCFIAISELLYTKTFKYPESGFMFSFYNSRPERLREMDEEEQFRRLVKNNPFAHAMEAILEHCVRELPTSDVFVSGEIATSELDPGMIVFL